MSWFARVPGEFCIQITKVEHKEEMRLCIMHEVIGMQPLAPKGGLVHENRPYHREARRGMQLVLRRFHSCQGMESERAAKITSLYKGQGPHGALRFFQV